MQKQSLIGKSLDELKELVSELSMPAFTAKQISEWIYRKRVLSIDEMSNISAKNRALLAEKYEIGRKAPVQTMESADGTKKFLFETENNRFIETVFIPEDDRATLCVSIQVGCKMNCLFCMTGKQGFNGQLSPAEVLNQILSIPDFDELTNIVFMGMGEPFDNVLSLLKTLEIITVPFSLSLITGSFSFLNRSRPTFSRPMLFSIPDGVSAILGTGFPFLGFKDRPFSVIPPSKFTS